MKEKLSNNAGIWIKYPKESDHMKLVKSIQEKGTNWCIAEEETAKKQLSYSDFYIYYSYDKDNQPTIPRIAIRMENAKIAEIRGVAANQNIESDMETIISQKLEKFPDKEKYMQEVQDMQQLTKIYKKYQRLELTPKELEFLYEIKREIRGFGYQKDPRIEEILHRRNKIKDFASIFNCQEEEIGINIEDLKTKNVIYYIGDLDLSFYRDPLSLSFKLPKYILGSLDLRNLKSAEGLALPEEIEEILNLESLKSIEGLVLPKKVDSLVLSSLTSAEGLNLPEKVNSIDLRGLTSAKWLKLPEKMDSLELSGLTNAKDLVLPKKIEGDLYLNGLTNAKGLVLPNEIKGIIYLRNLKSAEGLVLPKKMARVLYLSSLISVKGLKLPKKVDLLDLSSLTSAKGLKLPEKIDSLYLSSLINAKGLKLPKKYTFLI